MESDRKYRTFLALGLMALAFSFFQFFYANHLFLKEQIILFQNTLPYFLTYFSKPAWLASYLGDFFTQFFYLRTGGPVVLSISVLIIWLLTLSILNHLHSSKINYVMALLPALAELVMHCRISYSLSGTVALIIALIFSLVYLGIKNRTELYIFSIIAIPLAYWMVGFHMMTFAVIILARDLWTKKINLYRWIICLALVIAVPLIFRSRFLLTMQQTYLYPLTNSSSLWFASSVLLSLVGQSLFAPLYRRVPIVGIVAVSLLLGVWTATSFAGNADFKREKVLEMGNEAYFGNWNKVLSLAKSNGEKNAISSYFANMALAQNGKMPDELLQFYQPFTKSMFLEVGPTSSWISIFYSNEVYFLLGDMNLAQHSAMLGSIFSPNHRSSRMTRRMAEINLVIGETEAADKYLEMLNKTLFHKKFARKLLALSSQTDESSQWLARKRSLLSVADTLRRAGDEVAGLEKLVEANPQNKMAIDYLLCYHLLNKNLAAFKPILDRYYRNTGLLLPRVYAEALLVYLAANDQLAEETEYYKVEAVVKKNFMDYTHVYEKTNNDLSPLQSRYGSTYWFYYNFAKMGKK